MLVGFAAASRWYCSARVLAAHLGCRFAFRPQPGLAEFLHGPVHGTIVIVGFLLCLLKINEINVGRVFLSPLRKGDDAAIRGPDRVVVNVRMAR